MKCLTRKDLITTYVSYDARKKNNPIPKNIADWLWSDPNALDLELSRNNFKPGVITGYKTWQAVRLSRLDLLNCAVWNDMFRDFKSPSEHLPRVLNELIQHPVFVRWKPNRPTEWFDWLEGGNPFPDDWPLILRPAKKSEAPAKYYVEDGSGRAVCFLRRLVNHPEENGVAMGYLGVEPDSESRFMSGPDFRELLNLV
jgi:hypothetical protein